MTADVKVGVFGAGGRMGSTVCQAVLAAPGLELVAAVDPHHAGIELSQLGVHGCHVQVTGKSDGMAAADVAVDFTQLAAARENLRWCANAGVHAVVGTTGFTPEDFAEFAQLFAASPANAVIAPNFAIGAVLMAAASSDWAPDPTTHETLAGTRGGSGPAGIPIHAVRLRGMVAHQEVIFGTEGQSLSLRHDSYERSSFMPGVLMAIRAVGDRPGLTIGLDTLLGI